MANFPTIKVTEGNEFSLLIPLKRRTFESCRPIDEDIDAMELTDLVVKFGGVVYQPSVDESGVTIILPGTLARGTYDIVLTAKYQGSDIRAAYESAVSIVPWNSQSDAQQYVPGSPIVLESAYIIGGTLTDEELEQLKQDLREAIWSADQAREAAERAEQEFINQAEQLSGTAQETTLTDGIQTLSDKIDNIDVDTSGLAQQGSNDSATLTDTQAYASSAATDAAYIRSASDAAFPTLAKETSVKDGNDTAISVSKEVRSEVGTGSDTAAETGTLFAIVKWVKDKCKAIYNAVTDSTYGLSAIKQAVLDNAGIPTLTIPDSTASQELAPNTLYIFSTRSSTLTLTLGTPIVGVANEYHFFVVTDTTAPTINFPAGITWNGGSAPTIAASKTYEVSILNNVAAYFEV